MDMCNRHGYHACIQEEEGLLALSGLFLELDPLGKRGEMHVPLDSSNFVEMHLFPDLSGLFSKRCTLGAEFLLWWQTDLFLLDSLHNVVSEIYWDLISICCWVFFEIPCPLEYWVSLGDVLE